MAAWLGGLVIAAGLGYTSANWVGAILTASSIVLAPISASIDKNRGRRARSLVVAGSASPVGETATLSPH
ncbi:hypothetical protein [Streptomyces sp. NPDC002738]